MQNFLAQLPDIPDIYRPWAVSYINGLQFSHFKVCHVPFQILEFFQKIVPVDCTF